MKKILINFLFLSFFIASFFITVRDSDVVYPMSLLISSVIFIVVLNKSLNSKLETLPLHLMLFVFIFGYIYKTVYTLSIIDDSVKISSIYKEWYFIEKPDIENSMFFISVFFLFFSIPFLFFNIKKPSQDKKILHSSRFISLSKLMVIFIFTLSVILTLVRASLGVGVMGKDNAQTGLLFTLMFRTQEIIIPGLLIYFAWIFSDVKNSRFQFFSLLSLFVHYVSLSLISGSKSGLIYFIFLCFSFWSLQGLITKKKIFFILLSFFIIAISYSYFTSIRGYLLKGTDYHDAIFLAFQDLLDGNVFSILGESLFRMTNRIIGAEGVWYFEHFISNRVDSYQYFFTEIESKGLSLFFTNNLVGVYRDGDYRSPGIVAMSLMIFSKYFFPLFSFFFSIAILTVWNVISKSYLAIPILTTFCLFILNLLVEGVFHLADITVFIVYCSFMFLFSKWLMVITKTKIAIMK